MKYFVSGLVTLLPVFLTLYIFYSVVDFLERSLGGIFRQLMPPPLDIPGVGLIISFLFISLVGFIARYYLAERVIQNIERLLETLPFVKVIYSPLKDLVNLFSKKNQKAMGRVVLVRQGGAKEGPQYLGIITQENCADLVNDPHLRYKISVFIPFSYAWGGLTMVVPKDQVEELSIPPERAMTLALTGWVKVENKNGEPLQS
jgi:uncharacterized membrane protein